MSTQVTVPARNPKKAPKPPDLIKDDPIAVEYWYSIWAEGVATLWTESDQHTAARAAHMQGAVARCGASGEAMTRLNVQIMKLESVLFLTPQARRVYGIVIEKEPVARTTKSRKEELEARLREVG
jgi:hypothetical protein